MSSARWKLAFLLLLASIDIFYVTLAGANVRLFPMGFACCLAADLLSYLSRANRHHDSLPPLSRSFVIGGCVVVAALACHAAFLSVDSARSFQILVLLAGNVLGAVYTYRLARYRVRPQTAAAVLYWIMMLAATIVILQFILAMAGLYQPNKYGIEGIAGWGRSSGLFDDPGWLAWWLGGLMVAYSFLGKSDSTHRKTGLFAVCLIAAMASLSRALLVLLVICAFLLFNKRIAAVILIGCALLIIVSIPSDSMDTLLGDWASLATNPRSTDAGMIVDSVFSGEREWSGFGAGTLRLLNEQYPWRQFKTSNVLLVNTFFEYGWPGVVLVVVLIVVGCWRLRTHRGRAMFLVMAVMLNVHNASLKGFFWVVIAMLYAADSLASVGSVHVRALTAHDARQIALAREPRPRVALTGLAHPASTGEARWSLGSPNPTESRRIDDVRTPTN